MLDLISKNLHEIAVNKASRYLVAEAELLNAIIEIDRHRIFEKFGEAYLTPYCVKYLNLSEDVAAMFVRVARKSLQVPELELAVQGGLQMSKAKTIVSVITGDNKEAWIEMAQTLTKEKLEREVASANPSVAKPEKAKPTGPDRIRIEFEVTFEEAEFLKRARELMSQKKSYHAQIGETFVTALKDWVDREDPIRKAERADERRLKQDAKCKSTNHKVQEWSQIRSQQQSQKWPQDQSIHQSSKRSSVPTKILHQVRLRDRGGCRKRMPDGSNCGHRKWTEIHHIIPKALGGTDTLENLITLCKAHHRQLHKQFHRDSA